MGSTIGVMKVAARRIGISFDEYSAHVSAGEKWCHKGKHWSPVSAFAHDKSRGDGYKAVCQDCDYVRTRTAPGQRERRQKRLLGLAYCCKCENWLPLADVYNGTCRFHINQGNRERYASDPNYQRERRQHAHARKRGIKPVPPIGQEHILAEFGGKCAYCSNIATTWDHVYPVAKSGITTPSNIVPACETCNSSKKDSNVFMWLATTARTPNAALFDRLILSECSPQCVYEYPEV